MENQNLFLGIFVLTGFSVCVFLCPKRSKFRESSRVATTELKKNKSFVYSQFNCRSVLYNSVSAKTKEIILCWTPSYIGVRGKERADSAAKSALDLTPDKSRIPYTDLKPTIDKFLRTKWQQRWRYNIHNKLFQIQPTLGEWRPASRKSRTEQVVISRFWIGHTRLTHSFILKQEPQPQCLTCHQLAHSYKCRAFAVIRKRFFKLNNLTDLFENVK